MLTNSQIKLIKSLHTKKGRQKSGLCLVEGEKVIQMAKKFIEFTFTDKEKDFHKLVTTETPQKIAAVARIPGHTIEDVKKKDVIVVLDNVQDPGNVGTILRLCLGFDAGLILINSADPSAPKVIRSSVGAIFQTPWVKLSADDLKKFDRKIFRLEKGKTTRHSPLRETMTEHEPILIIAGSEGKGITLPTKGQSLEIEHHAKLESLNVANALAIVLHHIYSK